MSKLNQKQRGQVFTPDFIVDKMCELLKNKGTTLEPSAGDGAFTKKLKGIVSIEKDKSVITDKNTINIDFFDYDTSNKFDSIIGNPPYVRHNDIENDTAKKIDYTLFDKRTNLFLFFIEKAVKHLKKGGELVFITPREFINLTSARKLNEFLYKSGTITDFIDCGDAKIFDGACPNVAIWRFEKDNFTRRTNGRQDFTCVNGKISFIPPNKGVMLSDLFDVRVGAVSGADGIFTSEKGNTEFVCSKTIKTGEVKKMFFNVEHKDLKKHKSELLKRKIKHFSNNDWYKWGRTHHISNKPRIYVNCKTRQKSPFFTHRCKNYDGSVLALFPKKDIDIKKYVDVLNNVDWENQGFISNGRFLFTQRSLSNAVILEK